MQPEDTGRHPVHILNGDALLERFPADIPGQRIVLRECLCEGPVNGDSLTDFFRDRAAFIAGRYSTWSKTDYHRHSEDEIRKISALPGASEVTLWFEDDLFCQVNLWFAAHLLQETGHSGLVFLVRPGGDHPYSFGALDDVELKYAFMNRKEAQAGTFSDLWKHYRGDDVPAMLRIAKDQADNYPFLLPAIRAHRDRYPEDGGPGRPQQLLSKIIDEIDKDDFTAICRAFNERAAIYGYGDLQVRSLLRDMGWNDLYN